MALLAGACWGLWGLSLVLGLAWSYDRRLQAVLGLGRRREEEREERVGCYWRGARRLARRFGLEGDEAIRRKLDLAGLGERLSPGTFEGAKIQGLLVGGGTALLGMLLFGLFGVVLGLLVGGVLFFWPDVVVGRRGRERQERLGVEVPDAVDVMSVALEAGLGFDRCVQLYRERFGGPFAEELGRAQEEMLTGKPRREAMEALRERNRSEELERFVRMVVQSEELGVPVAEAMRQLARQVREGRGQRARELAAKASPKITLINALFVAPIMMVFLLGSVLLNVVLNRHFMHLPVIFGGIHGGILGR